MGEDGGACVKGTVRDPASVNGGGCAPGWFWLWCDVAAEVPKGGTTNGVGRLFGFALGGFGLFAGRGFLGGGGFGVGFRGGQGADGGSDGAADGGSNGAGHGANDGAGG